jgi:hypothetical protein
MTTSKPLFLTLCLAAALLLPPPSCLAVPLPEFGPSIQFDPSGPQPTVAKLKGKAAIVLFFESDDKASNAWAGELLKEMEEAYGTNQTVVLVGIKTDGGSTTSAKGYLADKGTNTDNWLVGCDKGAKYATDLVGDPKWYYVLVSADGNIVERGKAGITHNVAVGPDKKKKEKRYNLANPAILKACGKVSTVLPAGKSYQPSVRPLARLAELGDAEKALVLCAGLLVKPKEKQAAAELLADLQPAVEKRIADRVTLLGDASGASAARYDAYNELTAMQKELKTNPLAAKISTALAKARQDPALQKEARADSAYQQLATRVQRASSRDKPRLAKELRTFAQQAEGTKAGQLASDLASELESAVQ